MGIMHSDKKVTSFTKDPQAKTRGHDRFIFLISIQYARKDMVKQISSQRSNIVTDTWIQPVPLLFLSNLIF